MKAFAFGFPFMRLWAIRAIRQRAILALGQLGELWPIPGALLADSLQKQEELVVAGA